LTKQVQEQGDDSEARSAGREILQVAIEAAGTGAAVLLEAWHGAGAEGRLRVERKALNDLVSQADRDSEAAILEVIRGRFPDHRIVAEEGGGSGLNRTADFEWLCDPLDGTTNFLERLPIWCVSIACRHRGELIAGVVIDPLRGEVFAASRGGGATRNGVPMRVSGKTNAGDAFLSTGFPFRAHAAIDLYLAVFRDVFLGARAIRRCGAAALDLAHVAAGIYDGFFELRLSSWDVAAGAILIEEAGGVVTDWDGHAGYVASGNIIAGSPAVHAALLGWARRHGSERAIAGLVPD
jgi:myo-inositol-1(or 4)-monophosphatase